jgi:hypothetical protein
MADARSDRIDAAVSAASELIGTLQEHGSITPNQARVLIEAAVRAAVSNFQEWEVRASAKRVAAELENEKARRAGKPVQLGLFDGENDEAVGA